MAAVVEGGFEIKGRATWSKRFCVLRSEGGAHKLLTYASRAARDKEGSKPQSVCGVGAAIDMPDRGGKYRDNRFNVRLEDGKTLLALSAETAEVKAEFLARLPRGDGAAPPGEDDDAEEGDQAAADARRQQVADGMGPAKYEEYANVFKACDTDGDEELNMDELVAAVAQLQPGVSRERLGALVKKDGDGAVDIQ